MTPRYRFSIAVPTRNRSGTLRHTLRTCLDQRGFDDYEILVNDNSDNDESELLVARLAAEDPRARRINYNRRSHVCSASNNFEEVISRASGEYVIVLGDDDGIMPMALNELDALIRQTGAAVIRWRAGQYNWPDLTFNNGANYLGFCLARTYGVADGRIELARALDLLSYEHLPMLYINAAVRRDVVDAMRDGEGRLFRSRSPDAYSAVTLAYICGKYLDVSIPFTLGGLSAASNRVSTGLGGDNSAPRLDFRKLNDRDGVLMHEHVPNIALHPVIDLADSFCWAKQYLFPHDDNISLSRSRLIKCCVEGTNPQASLVSQEIRRACGDDVELLALVDQDVAERAPRVPPFRLRPEPLGAHDLYLHLDASDFGVETIAGAVNLVHKIVWPADAPIRYDLGLAA